MDGRKACSCAQQGQHYLRHLVLLLTLLARKEGRDVVLSKGAITIQIAFFRECSGAGRDGKQDGRIC